MSAVGSERGLRKRRVLLRIYVYGVALLALLWIALYAVGRLVVAPAVSASVRPLAGWIVPRLAEARGDPARLAAETADLKTRLNMDLTLYDRSGKLLATNVEPPLPALRPEETARFANESVLVLGDTPMYAVPINDGAEITGYGLLIRPPRHLSQRTSWVAFLAVLVVLGIGAVPFARSIVRPIERLAAVTRSFGKGDLTARAGIYPNDELGELARAFDEMADRVTFLLRTEKELLANVSHELRTPLARIRVVLELASDGDPARAQRYLKEIAEDLGELERLVDDVLTAARLDLAEGRVGEGLPPLRTVHVDASALVNRAASRFRERHAARVLTVTKADDSPTIVVDVDLLRRALDNLLENAHKYSDAGSPIKLTASTVDGQLVVEVRDQGIGIDPADLPMVFKPFFRGDRSRARRTGGVGLGLALARRIVQAHGGTIEIESQVGVGTKARFSVPIVEMETEPGSTEPDVPAESAAPAA